jgi:carbonic anhydrase
MGRSGGLKKIAQSSRRMEAEVKAGLDQMTAWLLAVALSSALFGAGYGVTRLVGRGEDHDDDHGQSHGDGHGDAHATGHGDSHGSGDSHAPSDHNDHEKTSKHTVDQHSDSHGASSRGGHGDGHDQNPTNDHGSNEHEKGSHAVDSHSKDSHSKDSHSKDSHSKDSHSKDSHSKDSHSGHDGASDRSSPLKQKNTLPNEDSAKGVKWGYTGSEAPAYWADLSPGYSLCRTGRQQSPIDIDETGANPKLLPIRFLYREGLLVLENSGLAVEGRPAPGSYVEVDGERYDLRLVRFHTPSEHKVAGAPYDMEMQLLHSSADGERLHISVFFEEGGTHKLLDKLWAHLPEEVGRAGASVAFNLETLLPSRRVYFHYRGSLTTPPCTEGVKWFVLSQSVDASSKQIDQLSSRVLRNIRPIQGLNGRKVVRSAR